MMFVCLRVYHASKSHTIGNLAYREYRLAGRERPARQVSGQKKTRGRLCSLPRVSLKRTLQNFGSSMSDPNPAQVAGKTRPSE